MEDVEETSIRARITVPEGGQLVTTGLPGMLVGHDGTAYIDVEAMEATFRKLSQMKVRRLLVMVADDELPEGAEPCLEVAAERYDVELTRAPIEDFSVPDETFLRTWDEIGPELHALLNRGEGCALSCHYGAGRSGMIAALILAERGAEPHSAILQVREQFPESIESLEQENWLLSRSADCSA